MYANYHTHTARCHHAVGADEEYVRYAIAEGVKVLGFSDHAPMRYKGGYVSYYKMTPDELDGYVSSVLSLRDKYRDKIEIRLGLEIEYYPSLWDDSIEFLSKYPIEYLILGQHFVGEETDKVRDPSPAASADRARLTQYVDRVLTAIGTGRITYIAHPDLLNYTGGDLDFYFSEVGRLIDGARALDMPLEYNLLGMAGARSYPNPLFWEEAARRGAKAILGCDAHEPWRVAVKDELARATAYLDSLGIEIVDRVKLVDPFK